MIEPNGQMSDAQIKRMVDACMDDINAEEWDGGGAIYASSIGSEREFVEELRALGDLHGYGTLSVEQIARLTIAYQKA